MKKLAIITSHPIQYNAPFFKMLAQRGVIQIKVFYTWSQSSDGIKFDPGFGKSIEWDIPLLDGYDYTFCENMSSKPGSHHFFGINNPSLNSEIKNWGANAVLIYGWAFKSHLKAILHFKNKIPVYFRGDSTLLNHSKSFKSKIKEFFLKYVYSKIDVAFFVGIENKKYFKKFGVNENCLIFMPHAIDNARFVTNPNTVFEAQQIRSKLGIKIDDFVFLFAGKFEQIKNPMLLLEAFENCTNNFNAHLIMVGNGEMEKQMKQNFGSSVNIHFLNFQNQSLMPAIYSMCNIFVLPSKSETWGLAINEAMAAGKAIIASNTCGAVSNLVHHNINGYSFESNSLLELVNLLQLCLAKNNQIVEFGIKSTEIIKEYSFQNNCEILELKLANEI